MDSDVRVYVAGDEVTPADTLFVTSLYSLPYRAMDVFNQYAVYAVLEQCGFYLPAPPALSPLVNDKLATILHLKDSPVPVIPTLRLGTGRDLSFGLNEPALRRVTFPAIVKPTGWCGGWGINLAHNMGDLRGLLSLAQSGDTCLVVQALPGPQHGRPAGLPRRRQAALGRQAFAQIEGYVGNLGRGGRAEYVPLPAELASALDFFAERVPIPFLCVDFLFDGERYWFSEIEPDGSIFCPDPTSKAVREHQRSIIEARFRAYRRGHAQWLGHKVEEASHA